MLSYNETQGDGKGKGRRVPPAKIAMSDQPNVFQANIASELPVLKLIQGVNPGDTLTFHRIGLFLHANEARPKTFIVHPDGSGEFITVECYDSNLESEEDTVGTITPARPVFREEAMELFLAGHLQANQFRIKAPNAEFNPTTEEEVPPYGAVLDALIQAEKSANDHIIEAMVGKFQRAPTFPAFFFSHDDQLAMNFSANEFRRNPDGDRHVSCREGEVLIKFIIPISDTVQGIVYVRIPNTVFAPPSVIKRGESIDRFSKVISFIQSATSKHNYPTDFIFKPDTDDLVAQCALADLVGGNLPCNSGVVGMHLHNLYTMSLPEDKKRFDVMNKATVFMNKAGQFDPEALPAIRQAGVVSFPAAEIKSKFDVLGAMLDVINRSAKMFWHAPLEQKRKTGYFLQATFSADFSTLNVDGERFDFEPLPKEKPEDRYQKFKFMRKTTIALGDLQTVKLMHYNLDSEVKLPDIVIKPPKQRREVELEDQSWGGQMDAQTEHTREERGGWQSRGRGGRGGRSRGRGFGRGRGGGYRQPREDRAGAAGAGGAGGHQSFRMP